MFRSGTKWTFKTARFTVELELTRDHNYKYDGDDLDGSIQANLNSGKYVAFDSAVKVYLDGEEIATDYLGGSVYDRDNWKEFFTAHRDSDPMNRNCSIMRAARGENVVICHYFPGMVNEAIRAARAELAQRKQLPKMRK